MEKSNLNVAYDIMLKNKQLKFKDLWEKVCEVQGYDEEEAKARMGKFYTNLFMDGRFFTLGENVWDLCDRYTYDVVHENDDKALYREDDETPEVNSEEEEERRENYEYDSSENESDEDGEDGENDSERDEYSSEEDY